MSPYAREDAARDHIQEIDAGDVGMILARAERPIVIYYWADDCPPCNLMKPKLRIASQNWYRQIDLYSVHLQRDAESLKNNPVHTFPTFIVYGANGQLLHRLEGYVREKRIEKAIADTVGAATASTQRKITVKGPELRKTPGKNE